MAKSYLFLALVLGLVLVKTCSAKALPLDADSDDEYTSDDEDESDSDSDDLYQIEHNPATICMLFGDKGCNVECKVISQAYDVTGEGRCLDNQICYCHSDVSFHERWDELFDADYVYRKINEDPMIQNQAQQILSSPFKSGKELKPILKHILSPYQFSKLKIHDDSIAAELTEKGEDNIDEQAVQKFVSERVGKLLKSGNNRSLLNANYKQNFRKFLTESEVEKGTAYNLTTRVKYLKNQALEKILKEHLKKKNLEEPAVDVTGYKGLVPSLLNAVDKEIIKLNDEHHKNLIAKKKKKNASAKKPATKAPTKSRPAEKNKPATKSKPGPTEKNKPATKSKPGPAEKNKPAAKTE